MVSLILASGSPRRQELLAQLGYDFEIMVPNVEEHRAEGESARQYVARLSRDKANAVQMMSRGASIRKNGSSLNPVVIGSDTIVVVGEHILEKPSNYSDSERMLKLLSGNCHQVMTAVTVVNNEKSKTDVVVTNVWFKSLSKEEIEQYWRSGEPCDKAGSYAIQGLGGKFVSRIEGSFYAVVGLPLFETDQLLHEFL
jgi:septum formation protein